MWVGRIVIENVCRKLNIILFFVFLGEVRFYFVEFYNKGCLFVLLFVDIFWDYKVIMVENIFENFLKYLYFDIFKDKVFGKYYSF